MSNSRVTDYGKRAFFENNELTVKVGGELWLRCTLDIYTRKGDIWVDIRDPVGGEVIAHHKGLADDLHHLNIEGVMLKIVVAGT